ncbi:MAG: hypothetical protein AB7O96_14345 [Pseudobdellovibrionaceae bacterium]
MIATLIEILTHGWENFWIRTSGPMDFRFILQPTMAAFFATRAGLRDFRQGRPPFLWSGFYQKDSRPLLFRETRNDIGTLFVFALVLDAVYQAIMRQGIFVLEMLFTATLLALVPYALLRGPVSRLAYLLMRRKEKHKNLPANQKSSPKMEKYPS